MNTPWPAAAAALLAFVLALLSIWIFALYLLRRLRLHEISTRDRVTRSTLDDLGQLLMTKMDEKFDHMEAAQARREAERMAYLLKNAEVLGGVRSANQLLTGQLAILAAKLDRQIELTRLTVSGGNPKPQDSRLKENPRSTTQNPDLDI